MKKLSFRDVVHIEPYFETPKHRGHNNDEYKATSGNCVVAAQPEGEKKQVKRKLKVEEDLLKDTGMNLLASVCIINM